MKRIVVGPDSRYPGKYFCEIWEEGQKETGSWSYDSLPEQALSTLGAAVGWAEFNKLDVEYISDMSDKSKKPSRLHNLFDEKSRIVCILEFSEEQELQRARFFNSNGIELEGVTGVRVTAMSDGYFKLSSPDGKVMITLTPREADSLFVFMYSNRDKYVRANSAG